jgi:hypothetical protein
MASMNDDDIDCKMIILMKPLEQQIMMCDSDNELLMLACAMLTRTQIIFKQVLGDDGAKLMFKDLS